MNHPNYGAWPTARPSVETNGNLILVGESLGREGWEAVKQTVRKCSLKGKARAYYVRERAQSMALEGEVGRKLAELAGIGFDQYMARTTRLNVLNYWPGRQGKGSAFPAREAVDAAMKMVEGFNGKRVIFLGNRVTRAFGYEPSLMEWCTGGKVHTSQLMPVIYRWATVPHPSTVNRWWNKKANVTKASAFLREALWNQ